MSISQFGFVLLVINKNWETNFRRFTKFTGL